MKMPHRPAGGLPPVPALIIRADATPRMGAGHVMRCLALAQAARDVRRQVVFVGHVGIDWVRARLEREGVPCCFLEQPPLPQSAPEQLLDELGQAQRRAGCDLSAQAHVVLDGYHFDPACHKAVQATGYRLLVIDDNNHLPQYHCDVLLNQNVDAAGYKYHGRIGEVLPGLRYVLLRREVLAARGCAPMPGAAVRTVLLTLGGSDILDAARVLAPVFAVSAMQGRVLRVLPGSADPQALGAVFAACPGTVQVLPRGYDLVAALDGAQLCVTAGGSSCWELAFLGVPFLVCEIAANQAGIVRFLTRNGLAPLCTGEALTLCLSQPGMLADARTRLHELVDGKGAARVLRALIRAGVAVRRAEPEDSDFVCDVANDPVTRAVSFNPEPIPPAVHRDWHARQLADRTPFFIATYEGVRCGYVRFATVGDRAEISVALAPGFRGAGFGARVIELGCAACYAATPVRTVTARVKPGNLASLRAFAEAGFCEPQACGPELCGANYRLLIHQRPPDMHFGDSHDTVH